MNLSGKKPPSDAGVSRRDFLKTTGAGLLAVNAAGGLASPLQAETQAALQTSPQAGSRVQFLPHGQLTRISPHLYLLRDTCNVYLLQDGDRALLIDFGSGHILTLLGQVGVTKVDAILHTHHHRDQCQGDWRAAAERIPIHVPSHEQYLFDDAENFWRNRRVFHLYHVQNDFFSLTRNVPVAGVLLDYRKFRWGAYEFLIFPSPGHTIGSISMVGQVDGKLTAFTGDLIHSPGKVDDLYNLQYNYASIDGVDCALHSLSRLRELGPQLLCPSHGEPIPDPAAGIANLMNKLRGWCKLYAPATALTIDNQPFAVSPHLVCADHTMSTSYALISDSGKALMVDYGSASGNFFNTFNTAASVHDRMRFVEHTIPELKARYGLKSINVIMPSHMHDDHLNGFPHLVEHYGAKVWCYENMVDILENPRGNNLGCTLAERIPVDRAFHDGESFKWEEFTFTVYHSPGHTEYQMAMFAEIDGGRVAFTGDAIFPSDSTVGSAYQFRHNLIFRNWVENDSHLRSVRTILEHQPTLLAPGHGKPFVANTDDLKDMERRLKLQQRYFHNVIADPDCDFGLNPSWARLYPYQMLAQAGSDAPLELRIRNYHPKPMHVEATLILPPGWVFAPRTLDFTVPAASAGTGNFRISIPGDWDRNQPRVALAADLIVDGQYIGQVAEGVVDLQFPGAIAEGSV